MINLREFIEDFEDLLYSLETGDFKQAGEDLGDILYKIFLVELLSDDYPIREFIAGFLLGIHETKTIEDLIKCLKNADEILEKIRKALELIKNMKSVDDILKGLKMLFAAFLELEELIMPCLEGFEQFKRILKEIRNADLRKLALKIIAKWPFFLDDLIECIIAFEKGNFEKAGKCLGDILYRLFLVDAYEKGKPFLLFVAGFLQGIHEPKTLKDLYECMKDSRELIDMLKRAVKALIIAVKHFKIKEAIELVKKILYLTKKIHENTADCLKEFEVLMKLIKAVHYVIKNRKFKEVIKKIMANPKAYLFDIWIMATSFLRWEFAQAGKAFGDIHYRLFLV